MDIRKYSKEVPESLPIIDSLTISQTPKTPHIYNYHLRVTQPSYTKEQIQEAFEKLGWCKYLIGEEIGQGGNYHTHSFVETDVPYNVKEQKRFYTKLRTELKLTEFSSSIMKNEHLLSYVVKDGCYIAKGFDPKVLKEAEAKSYKKYSKVDFAKAQHAIEDEYLTDKITFLRAIEKFIKLKTDYKQNINRNWIKQYFTMLLFKHKPMQIHSYAQEVESSIQQDVLGIRFKESDYN